MSSSGNQIVHDGRAMGARGWVLLCSAAAISAGVGWMAARLAGFPYYDGYQGVLVQQPWGTLAVSLLAAAIAVLVATRVATTLSFLRDPRLDAAVGTFALSGFALRGGSMASVLAAASGPESFVMLAGELVVLGLIVFGAFWLVGRGAQRDLGGHEFGNIAAGIIELVIFAAMMWICGKTLLQGQAMGAVFVSGIVTAWASYLATGKTWKYGWCVPIVCGVLGYIVNAFTASNMLLLDSPAAAFSTASPLQYAGLGPLGVMFGELFHRGEETQEQEKPSSGRARTDPA